MKLIVLYGPENSGKTTTLEIVYERLKRISVVNLNKFWYLDEIQRDFIDVLEVDKARFGIKGCNPPIRKIVSNPETLRIGIVTQGDYVKGTNSIESHLQFLLDEKCDIAVCPCSEKYNVSLTPRKQIEDFLKTHSSVDKGKEFNIMPYQNELQMANDILNEIKNLC